jgi:hypothetical protein
MTDNMLPNQKLDGFNEWCAMFNVSSKYNEGDVLHTRRKLSHIIFCDNYFNRAKRETTNDSIYRLPHTQISFTYGCE